MPRVRLAGAGGRCCRSKVRMCWARCVARVWVGGPAVTPSAGLGPPTCASPSPPLSPAVQHQAAQRRCAATHAVQAPKGGSSLHATFCRLRHAAQSAAHLLQQRGCQAGASARVVGWHTTVVQAVGRHPKHTLTQLPYNRQAGTLQQVIVIHVTCERGQPHMPSRSMREGLPPLLLPPGLPPAHGAASTAGFR